MSDSFARGIRRRQEQERRKRDREQLRDQGTATRLLFHGTAGVLADSIAASGIWVGSEGRCYLTSSRAIATNYAIWGAGLAARAGKDPPPPVTDVGRRIAAGKVAGSGPYVAAVAVVRVPAEMPLEGEENGCWVPLPWDSEMVRGDSLYINEPVPPRAVVGWELSRPAELSDPAKLAALHREGVLIAHAFPRAREGTPGGPFVSAIPDAAALIEAVRAASANGRSRRHGDQHWCGVAAMGERLLRDADRPDADAAAVFAFAVLHDAFHDGPDGRNPLHGEEAALFARELVERGLLRFSEERLAVLVDALARHDDGEVSDEPTTATCWDADRLTLARLSITPDPARLSTEAARKLAPTARALVRRPAEWGFVIYRYNLAAAASVVEAASVFDDDELSAVRA